MRKFFGLFGSVLLFYLINRLVGAWQEIPGDFHIKLIKVFDVYYELFIHEPVKIFITVEATLIPLLVVFLTYLTSWSGRKFNYRVGEEQGSARWATKQEIKSIANRDFEQNIIISSNTRLNRDTHSTNLNNNIAIFGGPGTGKTRNIFTPNLLQAVGNYTVNDPKGTVFGNTARFMKEKGYQIKVFNTSNLSNSMRYNPFMYIRSEEDILSMVESLLANTKGEGTSLGEDFWVKAEKMFLSALIAYLYYEQSPEEQNFESLSLLVEEAKVKDSNEDYVSPVDVLFEDLKEKNPEHFAVKQYIKFKSGAGNTMKSIIISVGVRLAPFDIIKVRDLTRTDELELEKMATEKTVLYVIMSDYDKTFNFLAAMLYTQLFNTLIRYADRTPKGLLPIPLFLEMDEIANVGKINNFDQILATIRSRNMYAALGLQALNQLKDMYKDSYEKILAMCSTVVYLGSNETQLLEYISKLLGKQTIDIRNITQSKGQHSNVSIGNNVVSRELMTASELKEIDKEKCVISIVGLKPILDDKFILEKHPNHRFTANHDSQNYLSFEEYYSSYHLDQLSQCDVHPIMQVEAGNVAHI